MHHNNNNIDAVTHARSSVSKPQTASRDAATAVDLAEPRGAGGRVWSESMTAALDDLRGAATSRRACLRNTLCR